MTATEQIYALIYELVPLTISLIGFIIGMVNILKKKAPYFFTLIIFAVGCFVIEQVSLAVNTVCEIYDTIWVGALGVFGCILFLLSANYGALDKVVDETGLTSGKKFLSLIAPTVLTVITVITFFIWKDRDMLSAVVLTLIMIPAIPAMTASHFSSRDCGVSGVTLITNLHFRIEILTIENRKSRRVPTTTDKRSKPSLQGIPMQ